MCRYFVQYKIQDDVALRVGADQHCEPCQDMPTYSSGIRVAAAPRCTTTGPVTNNATDVLCYRILAALREQKWRWVG